MQKIRPIIFGMLAAFGALVAEFVLSDAYFIFSGKEITLNYSEKITVFLFLVVLIEEIAKYIMILKLYEKQSAEKQGISSAIFLGLGFAIVESSFLYTQQNFAHLYLGSISAAALHVATAGIIGYLIILTQQTQKKSALKIVVTAIILHIGYNLLVIYNYSYLLVYCYLAIIFFLLIVFNQKFNHKHRP